MKKGLSFIYAMALMFHGPVAFALQGSIAAQDATFTDVTVLNLDASECVQTDANRKLVSSGPCGGGPGGSDTQIQVNEAGAFQGYSDLTFDTTPGLIVNESGSASVDTRFESDSNTHEFFLDASANSVGFNDSTPTEGAVVMQPSSNYVKTLYVAGPSEVGGAAVYAPSAAGVTGGLGYRAGGTWAGAYGEASDLSGTAAGYFISAATEGLGGRLALYVENASTMFYNTHFYILGSNYIFFVDPSANQATFGSDSDLGGLLNVDGRANEIELLVQGHSTQTNSIVVVEKSDGTDVMTVGTTGISGTDTTFTAISVTSLPATGGNAGTNVCLDANKRLCPCGSCA